MRCALCGSGIEEYDEKSNRFETENKTVDICARCIERFLRWQSERLAKLFPTKAAKKRFGK